MRKFLLFSLCLTFLLSASLFILGCNDKNKHTHAFTAETATNEYLCSKATCTEKARYYYSCECGEKGTKTFEYGKPLGHEYSDVVYNWMNNVCTAKRICTRTGCDHSEEETATITSTVTQQQSCEKDELTTYTATFNNSEFTTQTNVVKTKDSFGGHTYSTEWTYSGTEHWHECSRCHDKKDKAEHSFVNNICTVCSYAPYEAFAFTLNKDGNGYTLTKYSGTKQNVIIPSVYDGKPVSAIGNYAFAHCTKLTSITIGNSVTSIGNYAFYGCEGLTSITIPNGVTSIGDWAFSGCRGLTSVTVGNSITSIGYDAFRGCMGLTSITIPNSVTSIGDAAFYGCYRLIEVYNKSSLSITAGSENNGCIACYAKNVYKDEGGSKLSTDEKGYLIYTDEEEKILVAYTGKESTLTLPSDITQINKCAFSGCRGLTSVTIGNGVTSIGSGAFEYCSGLTSITVGNSITSIGYDAFSGCRGLSSVTIPDSVTSIGSGAFSGCSGLTSVTIGNGVTSIGASAFEGCNGLTSVTIPDSVTSISWHAFEGCNGLTSIYYTGGVAGWCGIKGLYNVTSPSRALYIDGKKVEGDLVIPDSMTSIGSYAFYGCSGLTSVTIPDSVTSIGERAFYNCSGLTSVTIGNSVTSIGSSAFAGCSGLTSVTIPDSVTSIGSYAFAGCSGLTSVTIPDSVTSIGSYAFYNCYKLVEVINKSGLNITKGSRDNGYIAYYVLNVKKGGTSDIVNKDGYLFYTYDNVNYLLAYVGANTDLTLPADYNGQNYEIYKYAFYNCSGLTSITIPDSVTSIGKSAFEYCSGLTSVTIGNSVTSIGGWAFYGCSGLTSVTIGNSVTSIRDWAFGGCSGLTSVTIPDSVTSIGNSAFCGCSGLTSVTIPDSVTSIGERAFYECSGLISVTIPDSVTSIGSHAFFNCYGLTSVTIGNGVTSIGSHAFNNCGELKTVYYKGTAGQWGNISIDSDNYKLTDAAWYYYSVSEPSLNAEGTAYDGNYWHYDTDGVTPVIWKKKN